MTVSELCDKLVFMMNERDLKREVMVEYHGHAKPMNTIHVNTIDGSLLMLHEPDESPEPGEEILDVDPTEDLNQDPEMGPEPDDLPELP
jgi:hypothetical protein